jgi:hypothetical protein
LEVNSFLSKRLPVRIFLSYAHKNDLLVTRLLSLLRDELDISARFAFTLWSDKGILIGSEWDQDIKKSLANCDFCLSLLTRILKHNWANCPALSSLCVSG